LEKPNLIDNNSMMNFAAKALEGVELLHNKTMAMA